MIFKKEDVQLARLALKAEKSGLAAKNLVLNYLRKNDFVILAKAKISSNIKEDSSFRWNDKYK